eukprot:806428-Rhodomonas_salina.2
MGPKARDTNGTVLCLSGRSSVESHLFVSKADARDANGNAVTTPSDFNLALDVLFGAQNMVPRDSPFDFLYWL